MGHDVGAAGKVMEGDWDVFIPGWSVMLGRRESDGERLVCVHPGWSVMLRWREGDGERLVCVHPRMGHDVGAAGKVMEGDWYVFIPGCGMMLGRRIGGCPDGSAIATQRVSAQPLWGRPQR